MAWWLLVEKVTLVTSQRHMTISTKARFDTGLGSFGRQYHYAEHFRTNDIVLNVISGPTTTGIMGYSRNSKATQNIIIMLRHGSGYLYTNVKQHHMSCWCNG